jgi:rubredoxin
VLCHIMLARASTATAFAHQCNASLCNPSLIMFAAYYSSFSLVSSLPCFLSFSFVRAMAEASYRATILAGGKKQKKLTTGWEVLGLEKEVAQREAMYGGQKRKYDKKGNQLNDEGKLENPEDAIPDDDDDAASDGPVSNVHECSQCGFTLFVAQGREDKFFGSSFKCPECGAAKDQFKAGGDDDDEE